MFYTQSLFTASGPIIRIFMDSSRVLDKETQALEAQLAGLEENPKTGDPRFDIREGLYMLKYHDADGYKILSYRILAKTLIGLVSLNRILVGT